MSMRSRIPLFLCAFATIASATLQAKPQAPTPLNDAIFEKEFKVQLSFSVTGAYPFTFSIVGGALPACLSLSPDGVLYGMPADTCRGTYAFTVAATDYNGSQTKHNYVLHVSDDGTVVAQAPGATAPPPPPQPQAITASQQQATPAPQSVAMPVSQTQATPTAQPVATPAPQSAAVTQQEGQPAIATVQKVDPPPIAATNQTAGNNDKTTSIGDSLPTRTTPAPTPPTQTNAPW